eukprot:1160668-Pelagomonas_calceolata.AAC.1
MELHGLNSWSPESSDTGRVGALAVTAGAVWTSEIHVVQLRSAPPEATLDLASAAPRPLSRAASQMMLHFKSSHSALVLTVQVNMTCWTQHFVVSALVSAQLEQTTIPDAAPFTLPLQPLAWLFGAWCVIWQYFILLECADLFKKDLENQKSQHLENKEEGDAGEGLMQ